MLDQLPNFLAAVLGEALAYTFGLLVLLVFVIELRDTIWAALNWYTDR